MGMFKKRSADPEEMERLKAEIASMSARLLASDRADQELRKTVEGLRTRLDTPIGPPPSEPPPSPSAPLVDPARLDELSETIEQLRSRVDGVESAATIDAPDDDAANDSAAIDELRSTMQRITDRIGELDGRITSISTELANQITEMSTDIDALGAHEPATDEVVDELRDAQTRLAGEQARYQIAFRQDLAELANRLKRA